MTAATIELPSVGDRYQWFAFGESVEAWVHELVPSLDGETLIVWRYSLYLKYMTVTCEMRMTPDFYKREVQELRAVRL